MIAYLIAAAIIAAGGFTTGWAVNGWRLNSDIADQKVEITQLAEANKRCGQNVKKAQDAMAELKRQQKARDDAAREAQAKADKEAKKHEAAAADAMKRKPVPKGQECEAMTDEALNYAKRRKAGQ